jgi:hypothetical protein
MRFGQLLAVERIKSNEAGWARYRCRCDCGTEKEVLAYHLRRGDTKSCGCLRRVRSRENITRYNHLRPMSNEQRDSIGHDLQAILSHWKPTC